ncbi:MAG: hypothetical protein ACM3XM_16665 [Mycobacterium leprae]
MSRRERFLLAVLAVVVLVAVPFYYMDRLMSAKRAELNKIEAAAAPARQKAVEVKHREEALAAHDAKMKSLSGGLVSADPAAEIRNALQSLADSSGVAVLSFSLHPGAAVPDLPGTVKFATTVQVSGSRTQFLTFLKGLEDSRYLITIPDLSLTFPAGPPAKGVPEVNLTLNLTFYGKAQQ